MDELGGEDEEGKADPHPPVGPGRVAEHYDELDAFYQELWSEYLHHGLWRTGSESLEAAVIRLVERAAEAVELEVGERVCDVGCGYGATARLLARSHGARVTGYTVSVRQVAAARRSGPEGTGPAPRYVRGDWLENDLPAASFAVVLALESTEHMRQKSRFFREAWRVLRPGGRLAVCAWTLPPELRPWQRRHLIGPPLDATPDRSGSPRRGALPGHGTGFPTPVEGFSPRGAGGVSRLRAGGSGA